MEPGRRCVSRYDALLRADAASMERTLLQKRASALGSTPKPHCDDGHGERRTDLKPRGHVEQLQKNGAAEHGQDGPKLRRARHHTPLPPPANVRTIEAVVEQPLLERGPAFTRRPSGQDQERDGRQHRDRDADDTDDECGKRSCTPKQVPRLSQHAWILSGKGHEHPAVIVIPPAEIRHSVRTGCKDLGVLHCAARADVAPRSSAEHPIPG